MAFPVLAKKLLELKAWRVLLYENSEIRVESGKAQFPHP